MRNGGRGNDCATHLIGSVYLRGSPSGVLHIVLLHLGTDFGAGSDVTCRLEEGEGWGHRKEGKWENKHRTWRENIFQKWRNGNKSVNEANMQPLSPVYHTTRLGGGAALGPMTRQKSFMERKKWAL